MTPVNSKLYEDLESRGLVQQVSDPELKTALGQKSLTLYCGFDPTADSLHVGHLLPLLTLRRFQMAGHRPIAVAGGATGMIGDPSGKSQERQLLSMEKLEANLNGIKKILSKILDLEGPLGASIVNNADWFEGVSYLHFLRDVGKHFTINYMLTKESVRARLEDREHGISYTEFSYMLLQSFDFYHLHRKMNCSLQIGGSDQWGNITAGCELIRRISAYEKPNEPHDAPTVFGMTLPLVTKSDGSKFGKTESGAVWLTPDRTSPYQFYQFFIRTADSDVIKMIRYFTFLSVGEIAELERSVQTQPEARVAQKKLAEEMVKLVHGEQELHKAEKASSALFGTEIKNLDAQTILDVFSDAPASKMERDRLGGAGLGILDLLAESGICASKGAARRDLTAGGIYLNNERASDPEKVITASDLIDGKYLVLRKGKKNYHLVSFT